MTINFFDEKNRLTYTKRTADDVWASTINKYCNINGKNVADIGCGGGIYSRKLIEMGAGHVFSVDFSEEMLKGAKQNNKWIKNISYQHGSAMETRLKAQCVDVILERALIHHLTRENLQFAVEEAYRLLKPNGTLIIQDRTPEDCLLRGTSHHLRGYFFEKYPELKIKEIARRYDVTTVSEVLNHAGFDNIQVVSLWEIRRTYDSVDELRFDLLNRTGRSILHELTDEQLEKLVDFITSNIETEEEIIEKDRWTLWFAQK